MTAFAICTKASEGGFGSIAAQLTEQAFAISLSVFGQVCDELRDLVAACLAQLSDVAVICGIGLNEGGIESVLANQQVEAIAQGVMAVDIDRLGFRSRCLQLPGWRKWT